MILSTHKYNFLVLSNPVHRFHVNKWDSFNLKWNNHKCFLLCQCACRKIHAEVLIILCLAVCRLYRMNEWIDVGNEKWMWHRTEKLLYIEKVFIKSSWMVLNVNVYGFNWAVGKGILKCDGYLMQRTIAPKIIQLHLYRNNRIECVDFGIHTGQM